MESIVLCLLICSQYEFRKDYLGYLQKTQLNWTQKSSLIVVTGFNDRTKLKKNKRNEGTR